MTQATQAVTVPAAPKSEGLLNDQRFRAYFYARISSQAAHLTALFALFLVVVIRMESSIYAVVFLLCVAATPVFGVAAAHAGRVLPGKLVLVVGNLVRAAICLLVLRADLTFLSVYLATLGLCALAEFYNPAESAALPAMTPKQRARHAVSWRRLAQFLGWLLGAVLVAPLVLKLAGPDALLAVCAFLSLVAAFLFLSLRNLSPRDGGQTGPLSPSEALKRVWLDLRTERTVLQVVVELTLVTSAMGMLIVMSPSYAAIALDAAPEDLSFLFAALVIGLVAGSWAAPYISRGGAGKFIVSAGFLLFTAAMVLLSFVRELAVVFQARAVPFDVFGRMTAVTHETFVAMLLLLPAGLAYSAVHVSAQVVLKRRAPRASRSQMAAFNTMAVNLLAIGPVLSAAALSSIVDVRLIALGFVLIMVLIALYLRLAAGVSEGIDFSNSDDAGDTSAQSARREI